ncbi:hypothetical protein HK104_008589 [Borealophlyctis nickersoniae]|nr:hypothetical protein HK104_008589 [Borealophlyctis nickersoniae]
MKEEELPRHVQEVGAKVWYYALKLCHEALLSIPPPAKTRKVLQATSAAAMLLNLDLAGLSPGPADEQPRQYSAPNQLVPTPRRSRSRRSRKRKPSAAGRLPPELLTAIFSNGLSKRTLSACCLVSKRWSNSAMPILYREVHLIDTDINWRLPLSLFQFFVSCAQDDIEDACKPPTSSLVLEGLPSTYNRPLRDATLAHLLVWRKDIRHLQLHNGAFGSVTVTALTTALQNIVCLELIDADINTKLLDTVLSSLSPTLKFLNLRNLWFKATLLRSFPNLMALVLAPDRFGKHPSRDWVTTVAVSCPALERLDLMGMRHTVNDSVVCQFLKSCPRLQIMSLLDCDVDDAALQSIAEHGASLTSLFLGSDFAHEMLTNKGVKALVKGLGSRLKRLSLRREKGVTDESLLALAAHCPNLETLDLLRTSISSAGLLALSLENNGPRRALRHLNINSLASAPRITASALSAVVQSCPRLEILIVPDDIQLESMGSAGEKLARKLAQRRKNEFMICEFDSDIWMREGLPMDVSNAAG